MKDDKDCKYEEGYYLATNKKSWVVDVIWISKDNESVKCMSAGDLILFFELEDWRDIVGPINRETFKASASQNPKDEV